MPIVITAAGRGHRMRSLTHGGAKELLELRSQPVIKYVLDEAFSASDTVIVVSAEDKRLLNAFLGSYNSTSGQRPQVVFQRRGRGNGAAILAAADQLNQTPFVAIWSDEVFQGGTRIPSLIKAWSTTGTTSVTCRQVTADEVEKCAIADLSEEIMDRGHLVSRVTEKPPARSIRSRIALLGGCVIGPSCRTMLELAGPEPDGEIYLSRALGELAKQSQLLAVFNDDSWHEVGSPEGFFSATEAMSD